jgi:hypothetical protein
MKKPKKQRKPPPGPKPEIPKIETTDWKETVKKALKKKYPETGWPKPPQKS